MRKFFFILFFFLPFSSFASFEFNASCKKIYGELINLNLKSAQSELEAEETADNKIYTLLDNYLDFLELTITEDKDLYNIRKRLKETRLADIEAGKMESPWFLYCKAEINLQWAFVEVKFGDYMNAAVDINKAYKQLEANKKKYPDFLPAKKCMGLVHALIGNIPGNYKWASDLAGIKGTVKEGIGELEEVLHAADKDKEQAWLQTESLFYLSFIQLNLNNEEKQQELLMERFAGTKKMDPLIIYASASLALHSGKNEQALALLSTYSSTNTEQPFYYLDYLHGLAFMNKLDTSNASFYFKRFVTHFAGMNFIRSAYRNLGWCCLLNDDEKGYTKYLQMAFAVGNSVTDEDKQSFKEAKSGEIPNVILLRSRLLFDGGYYRKAWSVLLEVIPSKTFSKTKEILEYEYRLARIHHKLENYNTAIDYYKLTVVSGEKYPYYFAANSALQLGLLYETLNDKVNARIWFSKCLAMKDHEYQDSIELKAKAGLSRVQ